MRVLAGGFCLLAITTGTVLAADIPGPAPMPPPVYVPAPPPFTWSGIYFGASAGFGFASGTATYTATTLFGAASATSSGTLDGAIAGGQIGFNWQFNSLVFGIEADGQWSGQSNTTNTVSCFGVCTLNETTKISWFATARARVGYAFDRFLVYGTAGGAYINASDSLSASAFGVTANVASISSNALGFVVGAGVEGAILDNLSVRAEYLFLYSDNFTGSTTIPILGGTISETATIRHSIVRAGINYRFPVGF